MSPARFSMDPEIATHTSPFTDLAVPRIEEPMGEALRDKWVNGTPDLPGALRRGELPLYMQLFRGGNDETLLNALVPLRDEIDPSVVTTLLAYSGWRPRLVGAWLAALREMTEFDDHIGRLLVRSDVMKAGMGYCLALARFNTDRARDYLVSYLEYYLGRPELWFEQDVAMAALVYLDQRSGRKDVAPVRDAWERFRQQRPGDLAEDLETMGAWFGMSVRQVERISALLWPGS